MCKSRFLVAAEMFEDELQAAIAEFHGQSHDDATQIGEADTCSDPDAVRRVAHRMRGTSTMLGASGVSQLCQEIDRAAGGGGVVALVEQLRHEIDAARDAMIQAAACDPG